MVTTEVRKEEISLKENSTALDFDKIFDDEPVDVLSQFERQLSQILDLNYRINFLLTEVKGLIRK